MFKIIHLPHPALRKKTVPIAKVDKKLLAFIKDLKETLKKQREPGGLGIAANQVGALYRLFLAVVNKKDVRVFINPEIIELSNAKIKMTEGCLSVPGLYSEIERPSKIKIKYQSLSNGTMEQWNNAIIEKIEEFDKLEARVIQHEMDHLNGVVFIDRALAQRTPIYRLIKGKKGKDEFEEVKI